MNTIEALAILTNLKVSFRKCDAAGLVVEVEKVCARCQGTGRYSRSLAYGDKCLGCTVKGKEPRTWKRMRAVVAARAAQRKADKDQAAKALRAAQNAEADARQARAEAAWEPTIASTAKVLRGSMTRTPESDAHAVNAMRLAAGLPEYLQRPNGTFETFTARVYAAV